MQQQVSTFERIREFAEPELTGTIGRPTLCNEEMADKILRNLAAGSYLITACEAAGVSYHSVRQWLLKGKEQRETGNLDNPYVKFASKLVRAEHSAEQALVTRLNVAEDWRAQAFLLERRHRDRWGKAEVAQQAQQILVISDQLAAGMLEALRIAASGSAAQAPGSAAQPALDAEFSQGSETKEEISE
jgi:hypothetical protein